MGRYRSGSNSQSMTSGATWSLIAVSTFACCAALAFLSEYRHQWIERERGIGALRRGRRAKGFWRGTAAREAGCHQIGTFNLRDFRALAPDLAGRVRTP